MSDLFLGAFLTLLDYKLVVGDSLVGLLPGVLGWILVVRGLRRMSEEEPAAAGILKRPIRIAKCLIPASGILYLIDLLGVDSSSYGHISRIQSLMLQAGMERAMDWIHLAVIVAVIAVMLIGYEVWWGCAEAVIRVEMNQGWKLGGSLMKEMLKAVIVVQIFVLVITTMLPAESVRMVGMFANWAVVICFLSTIDRTRSAFFRGMWL